MSYYPEFYYPGPGTAVAPTGPTNGSTLLSTLRAFLLGTSGLAGVLTDVYLNTAPPGFQIPFGIISLVSESPEINSSADYWSETRLQFTFVSTDDVLATFLGRLAYNALMPKSANPDGTFNTRARLTFTDGYEVGAYPQRQYLLPYAGRVNDQNLWGFSFAYRFLIGRAMGI